MFNKSQIMSRAWTLVKTQCHTISTALKQAWAEAKGATEEYTQKQIAHWLDRGAARAAMVKRHSAATSKQCWFLAKLIVDNGAHKSVIAEITRSNFSLTKRGASHQIDMYLNG